MNNVALLYRYCSLKLIVVLSWFLLTMILFFPGGISADVVNQYIESLCNVYFTTHPPIMALLMRLFAWTGHGLTILFVLHLMALGYGVYQITKALEHYHPKFHYFAFTIFLLFPPIVQTQIAWKDTGMLAAFLCFFGVMLNIQFLTSRKHIILHYVIAALFLVYACTVRYNAILAAPAMSFFLMHIAFRNMKMWPRLGLACALCFMLLGSGWVIKKLARSNPATRIEVQYINDIVAINYLTGERSAVLDSMYGVAHVDSYMSRYAFDGWSEEIARMPNKDSMKHNQFVIDLLAKDPRRDELIPFFTKGAPTRCYFPSEKDLRKEWIEKITRHPFYTLHAHVKFALHLIVSPQLLKDWHIYDSLVSPHRKPELLFSIFKLTVYGLGLLCLLINSVRYFRQKNQGFPVPLTTVKLTLLYSAYGLFATYLLVASPDCLRYVEATTYMILLALTIALIQILLKILKSKESFNVK